MTVSFSAIHPGVEDGETQLDERLAASVGAGEESALEEAYRRWGGDVYRVALAVLRSRPAAEDVTQDVFLRLWRRPERYDPTRGSLKAFLCLDARGRAVDRVRSERARRDREDRESRLASSEGPTGTEQLVMENISSELTRRALDALTAEERQVITIAYFEGLSYRAVAERTGVPEGTVKSRIRSGLKKMQGQLAGAGLV